MVRPSLFARIFGRFREGRGREEGLGDESFRDGANGARAHIDVRADARSAVLSPTNRISEPTSPVGGGRLSGRF